MKADWLEIEAATCQSQDRSATTHLREAPSTPATMSKQHSTLLLKRQQYRTLLRRCCWCRRGFSQPSW